MSKNQKVDIGKKELSKIKKVIKKLESFEEELKAKEKRLDKKIKKSEKLKENKLSKLKEKSAKSEKKVKKIEAKLKAKKDEAKELKKKVKVVENFEAPESENIPIVNVSAEDLVNAVEEPVKLKKTVSIKTAKAQEPSSNLNFKEAIANIRVLESAVEIDQFTKNEKRSTVKNAAVLRKKALERKEKRKSKVTSKVTSKVNPKRNSKSSAVSK